MNIDKRKENKKMKTYLVYEMDRGDRVLRMRTTDKEEAELHLNWMINHFRKAWIEIIEK